MDQKKLEELARESNLLSTIDESYASMQTQNPSFDQGLNLKFILVFIFLISSALSSAL